MASTNTIYVSMAVPSTPNLLYIFTPGLQLNSITEECENQLLFKQFQPAHVSSHMSHNRLLKCSWQLAGSEAESSSVAVYNPLYPTDTVRETHKSGPDTYDYISPEDLVNMSPTTHHTHSKSMHSFHASVHLLFKSEVELVGTGAHDAPLHARR